MKKIIGVLVIGLVIAFYITFLRFKEVGFIEMDGYLLTNNQITTNLYQENNEDREKIEIAQVKEMDKVYQQGNKLYVGENKKKEISFSYPLISKDGSRILNLSSTSKLIQLDYEQVENFPNTIIASGNLYHTSDYLKVDEEKYSFVLLEENLLMNTLPVKVITETEEKTIPIYSIIYFQEEEIRYYEFKEESWNYQEITGIDGETIIEIENNQTSYEDFLDLIQIKEKQEIMEEEEEIEEEDEEQEEVTPPSEEEEVEEGFVRPDVSLTKLNTNVYSLQAHLEITDKNNRITKSPTIEIYQNGSLFLRKTYYGSGDIEIVGLLPDSEFTIVGTYDYLNEEDKQIRRTFIEETIHTKDMSTLDSIQLTYQNGEVYAKKIILEEFGFLSEEESEALKGIKKITVKVGDKEFQVSSSSITKMKRLERVTYETGESLESNQTYQGTITIYDLAGNEMKVENNTFNTRTSKQAPTVNVKVEETDITRFTLGVEVENKDEIVLNRFRYEIYDENSKLVQEGEIKDKKINGNNLNTNIIYTVKIYADYDLEDGRGTRENELLKETKVSTNPLSSLGFIRVTFEEASVREDSANYRLYLNIDNTDKRLVELLDQVTIITKKQETGEEVSRITLTTNEVNKLKTGTFQDIIIENLESKTSYEVEVTSQIKQGDIRYDITTLSNLKEFMTKKKEAKVEIINQFTMEDFIDFDVRIEDSDLSIESDRVILEVRNKNTEALVLMRDLKINSDYERITLEKLEKGTPYVFRYIAEEYNTGYTNSSYEESKVLLEKEIITEVGIHGEVILDSLLPQITSRNLIDIGNEDKWRRYGSSEEDSIEIDEDDNLIYMSYKATVVGNAWIYSYYLPEYRNQEVTISFQAKYQDNSKLGIVKLVNDYSFELANYIFDIPIETGGNWVTFSKTVTLNDIGYIGFYLQNQTNDNTPISIVIKDFQVELGNKQTEYQKYSEEEDYQATFQMDLSDTKQEIVTNDFYVRLYENNQKISDTKYDLENHQIEDFEILKELSRNKEYRIELAIKIRDRFYTLDTLEFNSNEEIRSIHNSDDFFRMHTRGAYLVVADLDLRRSKIFSWLNKDDFNMTLDFQGHRMLLNNSRNETIPIFGSSGKLLNLDLHYYLDDPNKTLYSNGIFGENKGLISNIKITIETAIETPVVQFSPLCNVNNGTIENFIVYTKDNIHVGDDFGLLARRSNNGVIRNGYLYGEKIIASYPNIDSGEKKVGAVVGTLYIGSVLENVYSLIDIDTLPLEQLNSNDRVGNLVGLSYYSIVKNIYSVAGGDNRDLNTDPNLGIINTMQVSNSFYINNSIYNTSYSLKTSKTALWNTTFQERVLNSSTTQFNVNDFVSYGYYPHLIMNESMPVQEYIPLPELKDEDLVDIISVNNVDQQGSKAMVTLTVHNPANEKITDISIKDLTTTIISQQDDNGTTTLVIEVSNPIRYVSQYFIKSITSRNSFNLPYTREFEEGERVLQIELFKEVSTVDEWLEIKNSLSENYMLTADLDFQNKINPNLGNFSGILDGNNHTISNITSTSGNGVIISQLAGTVRNLYVEHISKTNSTNHSGLIGMTDPNFGSTIENVHVSDVKLAISEAVGGLVGQLYFASQIMNSSVTDISLFDISNFSTEVVIGGIAGFIDNAIIENCYVQGLDLETDFSFVSGMGSIVGRADNSTIQNVYATGTIRANNHNIGGIIGNSSGSSINFKNVYSNVNIYTTQGNVGGIVGQLVNKTSSVNNTLVLGDIYSKTSNENVRRTVGNRDINQNNYVWSNQHMNGMITTETNGETLLSTEQLNDPFTYQNFVQLGSAFSYQNLDINQLPYLYYKDTTKLLPNQKANYLNEHEFEVTEIEVSSSIDSAYIMIRLQNEDNFPINSVKIDGLTITGIRKNVTENGVTTLEISVKPSKAYDSYELQEIVYQKNGVEQIYNTSVKINLQFYKDIESFEDWQKISTIDPENYRLIADIDFSDKVNVNTEVVFNRLEGTDGGHTLKNLEIVSTKNNLSLIKQINTSISNVTFDNIKLSTTASGNYAGIIQYTYGSMENLTFQNITVDASRMTYVASVSYSYSTTIQNIQLSNITVSGNNQVAGFIGLMTEADVKNITLKTVNVTGKSYYVGGLIGLISNNLSSQAKQFYIEADDVHVISTGGTYHGILYGSGGCSNSTIKNSSVAGYNQVGGMAGSNHVYEVSKVIVENCNVSGNQYVGGISGNSGRVIDSSTVSNSTISGNSSTSLYVGGLSGYYYNEMRNSGIYHSTITNLGDYTGGLAGRVNVAEILRNAVQDCVISGNNYVGGVIGGNTETSHPRTIRHNTIQATINASGSGAGGIMGYYQNNNIDTTLGLYYTYYNLIENSTISASYNAGGLIGQVDAMKTADAIYNNIIVANVEAVNDPSTAGIVIGNGDALTTTMQNTLIYDQSQLNGEIVSGLDIIGIEEKNYGTALDLATQSTYTNRGITTAEFDFSPLSSGYYPILINTPGQELIPLPTSTFLLSTMSLAYQMNVMKSLPQVIAYASGINTINLEFSDLNEYVSIYINDTPYSLTDKTMTFYYDYQTDLRVVVTDGLNAKEYVFTPDDLRKTILTIGNNYYYLDNGKLISNQGKEYTDSFIHLYDHYALTNNGKILDLESGVYQENNITNLSQKQNTTPLYTFTYQNELIDTYYSYSLINQEKEVENQVFIKNGKVTMLKADSMYTGDSLIIDSYNNKDYLFVLGSDGKLYSLKSEIKYPNDFKNKEIIEMSSNILGNSSFVLVRYQDGSIYGFDYRTGVRIVSTVDNDISIVDYFVDKVRSTYQETFDSSYSDAYQEAQKLVTKLEEKSLEQVVGTKEQESYEYVEVYNPVKNSYELYEANSYLNGTSKVEAMTIDYNQSITDNIYQDYALYSYYQTSLPGKVVGAKVNGLYIFIGICTLIGSLFILLLTYKQKENTAK